MIVVCTYCYLIKVKAKQKHLFPNIIDIKIRTFCYFDNITKFEDFDLDNVLIDEKSYEKIFVFNISCKTLVGAVFQAEKYDFIYNRIRYRIIRIKSGIKFVVCHNYAKIEVDSCDSLLLENTLILHSVIILFKSVFNK